MALSETSRDPATYAQRTFQLPPGATDLLLVRHGQSEAYLDGQPFPLVGGQGDPPLSEAGRAQARMLCDRLASARVDAIYVTTLRRTAQTAAPVAERLGIEARVEADLREVHLGAWEAGLYRKNMAQDHPLARQVLERERWDVIPGAEPAEAFAARVGGAIRALAARHAGQRVVAVTHGGVIGQALAIATGSRPFAFIGADNASVSRLVIADGRWILRGFNDTGHVDGAG